MSERIKMTPSQLEEGAQFLQRTLGEMQQLSTQLDSRIREVSGNWEGQAQLAFLEQYDGVLFPVLRDTLPQVIEAMVAKLNGAAQAIRDTDAQIAQAFRG